MPVETSQCWSTSSWYYPGVPSKPAHQTCLEAGKSKTGMPYDAELSLNKMSQVGSSMETCECVNCVYWKPLNFSPIRGARITLPVSVFNNLDVLPGCKGANQTCKDAEQKLVLEECGMRTCSCKNTRENQNTAKYKGCRESIQNRKNQSTGIHLALHLATQNWSGPARSTTKCYVHPWSTRGCIFLRSRRSIQ